MTITETGQLSILFVLGYGKQEEIYFQDSERRGLFTSLSSKDSQMRDYQDWNVERILPFLLIRISGGMLSTDDGIECKLLVLNSKTKPYLTYYIGFYLLDSLL